MSHQTLQLKHIRADNPDYAAIDNQLLNATLTRLDTAIQAMLGRIKRGENAGFPRPKSIGRFRTIEARTVSPAWLRYEDSETAYITIKGLPLIKVWHKGRIPMPVKGEGGKTRLKLDKETGEIIGGGNPKPTWERGSWPLAIKITLKGRRLWVALAYEIDKPELPPEGARVGIDRGVNRRAACRAATSRPTRRQPAAARNGERPPPPHASRNTGAVKPSWAAKPSSRGGRCISRSATGGRVPLNFAG